MSDADSAAQQVSGHRDPLCGVGGWLRLFVVANLYIAPLLFVWHFLMAWTVIAMLALYDAGMIVVVMIETAVGAFFVWNWIRIARHLRDIEPLVVQEARRWLKFSFGWIILDTALVVMSGMDAELLQRALPKVMVGLIGFVIWYTYFNVSKRVKATYPDWDR